MRKLYRQAISLLLLVTFGSGAYGFSSKWVAHEVDHATIAASADHSHEAPLLDSRDDNPEGPQPMSDSEHRLLHCEPGPSSLFDELRVSTARPALLLPTLQIVLSADPESLFRPPRSTSLI